MGTFRGAEAEIAAGRAEAGEALISALDGRVLDATGSDEEISGTV